MEIVWAAVGIIFVVNIIRFYSDKTPKAGNRLIATYIGWFFVNIVLWTMSDRDRSGFFPFEYGDIDEYDISEFLIYVIGPPLLQFLLNFLNSKEYDKP